jgi:hypothetical protein
MPSWTHLPKRRDLLVEGCLPHPTERAPYALKQQEQLTDDDLKTRKFRPRSTTPSKSLALTGVFSP